MKKYFAMFLAVIFVLGFAASALAIQAEIPANTQAVVAKGGTQITLGGELRFRGEYRNNVNDFNSSVSTPGPVATAPSTNAGSEGAFYDMRIRLSLEAKVSANTTGFLQLESGNADNNDNVIWGDQSSATGTGAKGIFRQGNTKKGDLRILQAWVNYAGSGLLGVPAFMKVGHQPIKLGNGLFLDHSYWGDDAILLGVSPIKNMNVILHTIKFRESQVAFNDDTTAYGLIFSYDFDKNGSASFDATYVDGQNQTTVGTVRPDIHLWNLGLRGNYEFSGFGFLVDGEFQFGKINDFANNPKFEGYAFWVGAYYKWNPVKIYADWAYGSGDDKADAKTKMFVTTQGVDKHYTYVYEYRTAGAGGQQFGGLANTTFIRIGANAELMKGFTADLSLYFLRAATSYFGSPETALLGITPGAPTSSKNIGTELDYNFTYQIDKGLKYWVEGGYLWAGNYWQNISVGGKKDNAYAIRQGLQLNF